MKQLYKGDVYKSKYSDTRVLVVGYLISSIEEFLRRTFILTKDVVFENYLGDLYKTKQLNELWCHEVHYFKKDSSSQGFVELVTKYAFNEKDYVYEKQLSEQEVDNIILKLQIVGKVDKNAKYVSKEVIENYANEYINKYYTARNFLITNTIEEERTKFNKKWKEQRVLLDKTVLRIPNMGYLITISRKYMYLYSSRGEGYDKEYVYIGRADKDDEEECFKLYLKTVCYYNYSYIFEGKAIDLKDIKGKERICLYN